MSGDPLVSVVTVVRDDRAGLEATHASLRAQIFRGFEWIVVDGGSTDGTRDYITASTADIAWWRSGRDDGLYDAMNRGMAVARGAYLLFLNAGDALAGPDTLARLAEAASAAPAPDLIYGDSWEFAPGGRLYRKPARSHRLAWYGMFAQHQAMLFRCSTLAGLAYDTGYRIAADYAFVLELLARRASVLRLDQPIVVCAPPGLSALQAPQGRREQRMIRQKLLGWPPAACLALSSLQRLAWSLRRRWPTLFVRLRGRPGEPPRS